MDLEYMLGYLAGRYDIDREFLLNLCTVATKEGISLYITEEFAIGLVYKKKSGVFLVVAAEYLEDEEEEDEYGEGEEYDT